MRCVVSCVYAFAKLRAEFTAHNYAPVIGNMRFMLRAWAASRRVLNNIVNCERCEELICVNYFTGCLRAVLMYPQTA